MQLLGCDFSSSPTRRKPIVVARGQLCLEKRSVRLDELLHFATLDGWSEWLTGDAHGTWVGGFDLPFGLPRELVQALGWPTDWAVCMDFYASLSRAQIREQFKAFCAARPVGGKFAHRATDIPAGSSSSMKWVNPPVAYMLHAGLPRLRAAGLYFPGLQAHQAGAPRVALEAYPGLLARSIIGRRSYKSDAAAKQDEARHAARRELLAALESGATATGLSLALGADQRQSLLQDAKGDARDAVLCMLQAAWAAQRHAGGDALYGLPTQMDGLEGAIVIADLPYFA